MRQKFGRGRSFVSVLCLGLFAVLIISVLSKYTDYLNGVRLQAAKAFYFESDQLTPQGNEDLPYNLYNRDTNADYSFDISFHNWFDQLNISNVSYSVNIETDNPNVILNPSVINFEDGSNLAVGSFPKTTVTVTVPANTVLSDDILNITATAQENYYKQMKATFKINPKDSDKPSLKAVFHNSYTELFAQLDSGAVYTVSWPSWLSPDNSNDLLRSALNLNSSVQITGNDSYECLKFFVTGTVNLNDKFTIQKNSETPQSVDWAQQSQGGV